MSDDIVLRVADLKKHYKIKHGLSEPDIVKALDGVTFELKQNQTLAIVGESGCGKSTLAKTLMKIIPKTDGHYFLFGKDASDYSVKDFQEFIQMIFQDPYSSINPRKKAWQIIAEPLIINGSCSKQQCIDTAKAMMLKVGLRPETCNRYPHMFSGGQRQRIGIARALVMNPKILICDEPVSALDVSIQAQVLNLLNELQEQLALSYIFISHDLSVVEHLADHVAVMYLGKIVEYGPKEQIFSNPQHPYTKALLSSTPYIDPNGEKKKFKSLEGEMPSPINPPSGCAFHKRCQFAKDRCKLVSPPLREYNGRDASCHFLEEIND